MFPLADLLCCLWHPENSIGQKIYGNYFLVGKELSVGASSSQESCWSRKLHKSEWDWCSTWEEAALWELIALNCSSHRAQTQLRQIEINASLEHISFFVCWSVWTGTLWFRKHLNLSTFYKWIEQNREGTHLHPWPISKYKHVLDQSRVSHPTILLSLPFSRGHCLQQDIWVNHGYGNRPCSLVFIYVRVMLVQCARKWKHHPTSNTTLTVLAQTSVPGAS